MAEPGEILKKYHLNRTRKREEVLDVFISSPVALSMNEVREKMPGDCDRVTLYRNLKAFTEKGILHQVHLSNLDSKYVMPENILNPKTEKSEHLHFRCVQCEMVKCLTDQKINSLELPDGFRMLEANFVVYGICDSCNQK